MKRTIDIAESVYIRLEALAKGFDTPSDVISRLLDAFDKPDEVPMDPSPAEGPLENSDIQMRVSRALASMPQEDVDRFCDKRYSKSVFGINFPLLVRLPTTSDYQARNNAVKEKGVNRWTWKFSFTKGDFDYAICTQWYRWHDEAVRTWLSKMNIEH